MIYGKKYLRSYSKIFMMDIYQDSNILCEISRIVGYSNMKQKEIIDLLRGLPRRKGLGTKVPLDIIARDHRFCKSVIELYGVKGLFRLSNNLMIQIIPDINLCTLYINSTPVNVPRSETESMIARKCTANIDLKKLRQIKSDRFTNSILICYALNEMCRLNKIHVFHVKTYAAYIHNDTGISLYEGNIICPLSKLYVHSEYVRTISEGFIMKTVDVTPENIMKILTQMTVALHAYNSFVGYVNGDLRASTVLISSVPVDFIYMGIPVEADFTCKISDLTTSSCIIPGSNDISDRAPSSCVIPGRNDVSLRIFNGNPLADLYFTFSNFDYQCIKDEKYGFFYIIDDLFSSQTLFKTQNMDTPYYSSFDYYTLLISFLFDPHIYNIFFSTPCLYNTFWCPAWIYDSGQARDRIFRKMIDREIDTIDNVLSVLSGLKLRCDAVHDIIDKLVSAEIDNYHLRWNEQTVTDDSCDNKFLIDSDSNSQWTEVTITDDSCDNKSVIDSDSNSNWTEQSIDDNNCLAVIDNSCGWNCLDKFNSFTISD